MMQRFGLLGVASARRGLWCRGGAVKNQKTKVPFFSSSSSFSSSSPSLPPITNSITKVLIANRGEIACRVIRTCRRLGIQTVAVYSSADGPHALHATMADEAYLLGTGPTPAESYLLQDAILQICRDTGANAIHPGYGFLSENATFVEAIQKQQADHRIAFIGPGAEAIQAMGSKSHSKAIMEAAGVPTTPGFYENLEPQQQEDEQDAELLRHHAHLIGFPVLIKAVMGGGGKGMRLVWHEKDFVDALASCQRESKAAFGDARVLLEKYLVRPRHVEVQIMADSHGNAVHLYERDCSLQRRHQKVIEEAPASDLPAALRSRLGEMGTRAAKATNYVNAGTVEFLLDTTTTTPTNDEQDPPFYFCEMNTRLQVEHPVTELITGIDLVEWQLRVAAGQALPITQQSDMPAAVGHAFEARVYAENPARNFLPATGKLWHHRPPVVNNADNHDDGSTGSVRVDTGLQAGQDISMYYDPMISKLIVHDQDRPAALARLIRALQDYQIAGVPTNIDFLIQCARHDVFGQAGAVNTGFLDDYADDVRMTERTMPSPLAQTVGAYAVLLYLENRIGRLDSNTAPPAGPWSSRSGSWRMGGQLGRAQRTLRLVEGDDDGQEITSVSNRDGSFDVIVQQPNKGNGGDGDNSNDDASSSRADDDESSQSLFHITGTLAANGDMQVVVNHTQRIHLTTVLRVEQGTIQVRMWPQNPSFFDNNNDNDEEQSSSSSCWELNVEHPLLPNHDDITTGRGAGGGRHAAAGSGWVQSPMPGKIRRVLVAAGDAVEAGQVVMVMEAMKMEHSITSPMSGTIGRVHFKEGDQVQADQVVLEMADGQEDESDKNNDQDAGLVE